MTKKEIIAKVDAELKAQGINATSAQIESALAQVTNKQELNANDLDNVAGGFSPAAIIPYIPTIVDTVKGLFGGGDKGGDGGSGGGGTTTTNTLNQNDNTNNQGIQSNQQGGSGTQKSVQSIQTQGDVTL